LFLSFQLHLVNPIRHSGFSVPFDNGSGQVLLPEESKANYT